MLLCKVKSYKLHNSEVHRLRSADVQYTSPSTILFTIDIVSRLHIPRQGVSFSGNEAKFSGLTCSQLKAEIAHRGDNTSVRKNDIGPMLQT